MLRPCPFGENENACGRLFPQGTLEGGLGSWSPCLFSKRLSKDVPELLTEIRNHYKLGHAAACPTAVSRREQGEPVERKVLVFHCVLAREAQGRQGYSW